MAEGAVRQLVQTKAVGWVRDLQWPLLAAAVYYGAAESAFLIGTLSDRIFAPFWPPNVVLLCVLLLVPPARWWLYLAVVFVAHSVAELRVGMDVPQLLFAYLTNVLVAVVNAGWLRIAVGGAPWLGDLRKASYYILITAGISPAAVALAGAFVPILGGGPIERYWAFWGHWYVANALASLTLGPIFLAWFGTIGHSIIARPAQRSIEAILVGALLITVCLVTFESLNTSSNTFLPALLYLPLPLVLWMTFRFGAKGSSVAILVVTVILISHTLRGPSPFASSDSESNVLALQLFLTGSRSRSFCWAPQSTKCARWRRPRASSPARCCGHRTRNAAASRANCTTAPDRTSSLRRSCCASCRGACRHPAAPAPPS
jgi:integral membrane sensor domain MASE1